MDQKDTKNECGSRGATNAHIAHKKSVSGLFVAFVVMAVAGCASTKNLAEAVPAMSQIHLVGVYVAPADVAVSGYGWAEIGDDGIARDYRTSMERSGIAYTPTGENVAMGLDLTIRGPEPADWSVDLSSEVDLAMVGAEEIVREALGDVVADAASTDAIAGIDNLRAELGQFHDQISLRPAWGEALGEMLDANPNDGFIVVFVRVEVNTTFSSVSDDFMINDIRYSASVTDKYVDSARIVVLPGPLFRFSEARGRNLFLNYGFSAISDPGLAGRAPVLFPATTIPLESTDPSRNKSLSINSIDGSLIRVTYDTPPSVEVGDLGDTATTFETSFIEGMRELGDQMRNEIIRAR